MQALASALLVTAMLLVAAAPARATPAVAPTRKASLVTFAGGWIGHTRGLTISGGGVGKESIGDGCCDPVIDLRFRLSRPRGTTRNATATATVTAVRVRDRSAFTPRHPAPRVGETRSIRLKDGVITESLTGTDYCDAAAENTGMCGA